MFNFLIVFIALSSLFLFINNTKTKRESERLANLWPEIIESIISGLIAGVSIQETWINVCQQYPKFKAFREFLVIMQVENNLEKFPKSFKFWVLLANIYPSFLNRYTGY